MGRVFGSLGGSGRLDLLDADRRRACHDHGHAVGGREAVARVDVHSARGAPGARASVRLGDPRFQVERYSIAQLASNLGQDRCPQAQALRQLVRPVRRAVPGPAGESHRPHLDL